MKTLTDIARGIAQQAKRTTSKDINELCEIYVSDWKEEVLSAYLCNSDSSDRLIKELVSLKTAGSARAVAEAIRRLDGAIDYSLADAKSMIAYRVDCILDPEPGFECPKE